MNIPFGTFLGAKLRINLLFLLMLPLAWLLGIFWPFLMVFALVLIHELAHSAAAAALRVEVLEIELLPFGGVARMTNDLQTMPGREILIALAGPASNLLLAMGALFVDHFAPLPGEFLASFLSSNLLLAGFNMLPALPLDGGRVFRAALSLITGLRTATKAASITGMILGVGVFSLGVLTAFQGRANITFLVCGVLLAGMAWREGKQATALFLRDATMRQEALAHDGTLRVRHLVAPDNATVGEIVRHFSPRRYHVVTLLDECFRERGDITEGMLMRAMLRHGSGEPARSLLRSENGRRPPAA